MDPSLHIDPAPHATSREVRQKAETIQQKSGQLIDAFKAKITTLKENVQQLNTQHEVDVLTIAKRDQTIEDQGQTIEQHVATIAERDQTIEDQGQTIEQHVATIAERDQTIESQNEDIQVLKAQQKFQARKVDRLTQATLLQKMLIQTLKAKLAQAGMDSTAAAALLDTANNRIDAELLELDQE